MESNKAFQVGEPANFTEHADKEIDLAEVLADIARRLDVLEQHFSEQGLNDLAHAIELRIVSRLRYGGNPQIERPK